VNFLGLEKLVEIAEAFECSKKDKEASTITADELIEAFTILRGSDIGFVTVKKIHLSFSDYVSCYCQYLNEQKSNID